ncbi:fimbrial protein, partial [Acinetobacter baumannii]
MKRILLTGALLTAGFGVYGEANASCIIVNYQPNDVRMAVGRVVVRPSDPVGAVLRKATFPISSSGTQAMY